MKTRDNKLSIFENFECDHKLKGPSLKNISVNGDIIEWSPITNLTIGSSNKFTEDMLLVEYLTYLYSNNRTIMNWLKLKLAKAVSSAKNIKVVKYKSLDKIFNDIKTNLKNLELPENSLDFYIEQLKKAQDAGQTVLVEKLTKGIKEITVEKLLYTNEVVKYISEEDLVRFVDIHKVPEKILKLSWIKNYSRPIPDEVLEKKKTYDAKQVFDNYVILHLDISGDSAQMTEKEKEKAKDPILFGVTQGSRKLYYVADWVDEYCDLTLDKVLEVLSKDTVDVLS
jgi:hypothetical protein